MCLALEVINLLGSLSFVAWNSGVFFFLIRTIRVRPPSFCTSVVVSKLKICLKGKRFATEKNIQKKITYHEFQKDVDQKKIILCCWLVNHLKGN